MKRLIEQHKPQLKKLFALAVPIFFAQLAQSSMGLVDTIMSGRVSAADMAAIAVGASIWAPLVLFGNGLLLALPPTISYLNGSGQRDQIAHQIRQGLWIVVGCSVIFGLMIYHSYRILDVMDLPENLAEITEGYLKAMAFGLPGYLLMINFRGLNDGIAKTKPAMVIATLGLMLNIPINYIFIYGKLGLPAMGAVGCGYATAIVNWAMGLMMISYCKTARSQRDLQVFEKLFEKPDPQTLRQLLRLGFPIALAICSEVMLFAISALLLAPFGTTVVASHQVALSFSSTIFIFPLSFGMASTIMIGQFLGEGRFDMAKAFSKTVLFCGLLLATTLATFLLVFRFQVASIFSPNPEVVAMAGSLMVLTALYQFPDNMQVITTGILRGYKDTKSILLITTLCYWGIGIPLGFTLARTELVVPMMGAKGFWITFVISLTVAASLLLWRLRQLQKMPIEQLMLQLRNE